jgi:CheY-like chemotaxis protein/HPt (histidine-containing phosphotransfer) domain-containing protein/anti-sigma regulatory factor (Ser/Thr protein kinase)
MAASIAQSKDLEVNSLICSDIPQNMIGDPIRLKQILSNIINNAIKFTSNGEVTICASQIDETPDISIINFDIKDTGIGIEKEKLDLIFEEFSQADASTTRRFGGTGLGLTITKKIITKMNGKISVESEVGKGSTFTVTLPLKKDINATKDIPSELLDNLKILAVDSNPTNLKILDYYLSRTNCLVYKASSTEEVIEIINSEDKNISVVIIDEKMENKETEKISTIIHNSEKFKNVPLIQCSSLYNLADSASNRIFIECLSKPIKKDDLFAAIERAVNIAQGDKEAELGLQNNIYENFNKDSKILVVEDNEINLKLIKHILNNHGLSCDMVVNGKDALDAFKTKNYGLIFMDCQMPLLSGYETTKEIRKIENGQKHTPIVAMTANALAKDEEKCYEAGMDDYISKPIKIDLLFNIISKYLELAPKELEPKPIPGSNNAFNEINKIINSIMINLEFTQEEAETIFSEYINALPQFISELEKITEDTTEDNNLETLKKITHKLKGASSNLRVEKITFICNELERKIKENDKEACLSLIKEMNDYSQYLITPSCNQNP